MPSIIVNFDATFIQSQVLAAAQTAVYKWFTQKEHLAVSIQVAVRDLGKIVLECGGVGPVTERLAEQIRGYKQELRDMGVSEQEIDQI